MSSGGCMWLRARGLRMPDRCSMDSASTSQRCPFGLFELFDFPECHCVSLTILLTVPICQELGGAGEGWAARCQSSWLIQKVKMKVTAKALITDYNSISKKLNQTKYQLWLFPFPPSNDTGWRSSGAAQTRGGFTTMGTLSKGSCSYMDWDRIKECRYALDPGQPGEPAPLTITSFTLLYVGCAPNLVWRGQLSQWGMPGKAFVIAFSQA